MPDDPFLTFYGHPVMPAGANADPVSGDEFNGGGTNWPVWPTLVDMFIASDVIVLTDDLTSVFDGCADYTVPASGNTLTLKAQGDSCIVIRRRA